MMTHYCINCSDDVNPNRWALGFKTCLSCGEALARAVRHCIVPMHKSNYVPVTNRDDLVGINSKGGIVHNRK
jgi:ribosomal protein L37AE/L43A